MRTAQLPLDRLIRPGVMLVALALSAAACDRSSQNRALPEAETQSAPVVKSLGRIAALNKRVVTITVPPVPQRTVDDAFATEQFQRFKAAMLALDPHADVAIVKVVVRHASSGPFAFTKTHAFVFAADETGVWKYTTNLDDQLVRLHL